MNPSQQVSSLAAIFSSVHFMIKIPQNLQQPTSNRSIAAKDKKDLLVHVHICQDAEFIQPNTDDPLPHTQVEPSLMGFL